MATERDCPKYSQCKFVSWLVDRNNLLSKEFSYGDDCGKDVNECARLKNDSSINISDIGPRTAEELEIAFPKRFENEDGQLRRLP